MLSNLVKILGLVIQPSATPVLAMVWKDCLSKCDQPRYQPDSTLLTLLVSWIGICCDLFPACLFQVWISSSFRMHFFYLIIRMTKF